MGRREKSDPLSLRRGRTKNITSGRPVPRGCPAGVPRKSPVAEARPDQKHPFRAAGASRVSRRCPAGCGERCPAVSRRCPDDDDDDGDDDDGDDDGVPMMMMMLMLILLLMMMVMMMMMMVSR